MINVMKLIILDFDGTIADTEPLITSTLQATFAERGLEVPSRQACRQTIGLPLKDSFIKLHDMSSEEAEECVHTYERIFSKNNEAGAVHIFPDVETTLARLHKAGCTLTIATSRRRPSLVQFLNEMGIAQYIGFIVTVSDVKHAKPAPDMVLSTLKEYGAKPQDALVVGDTAFDITMGRTAGTHTCGVTYGNGSLSSLQEAQAEFIANSFDEVYNIAMSLLA